MNNTVIKVTAIGTQTNVSTVFFDVPKMAIINILKIWTVLPDKKGSAIRDESGKNILFVQETPEQIYELMGL